VDIEEAELVKRAKAVHRQFNTLLKDIEQYRAETLADFEY